jgi:hypothetical protein
MRELSIEPPTFSEHERYEIADKVINQLPESADIRGTAIENRREREHV